MSVDQPDDTHRSPGPAILPQGVRRLLVELAAEVLGALGETEVSAGLRKVRAFAPTRRARAAAAPLAMALERDQTFRRQVAVAWRRANPELAEQLTGGRIAPALAPELVAAGLYLCRPQGWERELDRWLAAVAADQRSTERDQQASRADVTSEQIEAALGLARSELAVAQAAVAQLTDELSTLRREQRRLRSEADRARSAVREIERKAAEEVERLCTALAERAGPGRSGGRSAHPGRLDRPGGERSSARARRGRSGATGRALAGPARAPAGGRLQRDHGGVRRAAAGGSAPVADRCPVGPGRPHLRRDHLLFRRGRGGRTVGGTGP